MKNIISLSIAILFLPAFTFGQQSLYAPANVAVTVAPSQARSVEAVHLDATLLATAPQRLTLPLDGLPAVALRTAASTSGDLSTWEGRLEGVEDSRVVITRQGDVAAGIVLAPGRAWQLLPQPDGSHVMAELEVQDFDECALEPGRGELPVLPTSSALPGAAADPAASTLAAAAQTAAAAATGPQVVRVLELYSTRVRNELGGDANAKLLIANSVALANTVFADSGVAVRLELAAALHHEMPSGESVTGVFEFLRTQPSVNALRRQHNADVVGAFVSQETSYCGVGSLYSGGIDDAFHVVSWSCAQGNLSYPHEVGHNLSAHHNPENADGGKPTSRAHYVCGEFRTVMGYPDPCSGYTPRVALFSSPRNQWKGQPAGIAGQRDNVSSMNQASPSVALFAEAAFSDRSACVPGDTTLCLAGGRFEVRMAWQDQGTTRQARAVPMSDESGYFWFFRDGNVEVLTKMIDGCAANGHHWSFLTGLTDRAFDVTVRDTRSGLARTYSNTTGQAFAPVQDTSAFPTCA